MVDWEAAAGGVAAGSCGRKECVAKESKEATVKHLAWFEMP